jgi:enoyl-CoA hydratase
VAVLVESRDAVAVVTISRPEALNALDGRTLHELLAVAEQIAADTSIRAVVLTGAGDKAFVAGADIAEMSGFSAEQARRFSLLGRRAMAAIEGASQPWVAAVNGFALGGGCELALACDIRFAAQNAKFGQPEIGLGVTPGFGGTQRLPRIVGLGWAKYICLSGRPIRAEQAERIGLVQGVFPREELLPAAMKLAGDLAQKSPLILDYLKRQLSRALDVDLDTGHEIERDLFALCFASHDQKEGMGAFLEKRAPEFRGD